ncbi:MULTISPECIES: hypothetical protein [unclassified Gordonia (in: high G+C Gram-positive bacteria)]|uniref:hypothetical protein n=1 Tax=unclassified Gordonia (in: high G+C Gram-positive bacteria) TaxID=2657482 RepID=UPI00200053AB|nr:MULTISPECIES: hypothetical protein [unclassified Gordonia (in: high G+C Gram-positive bacteria)]UQE74360.1 hypothetical protein MYK68_16790 [Gordonia sp. PP30]
MTKLDDDPLRPDSDAAPPAPELSYASSPCGSLSVTTTAEGLPVGLRIAQSQLAVSLDVLARRIVVLCRLARGDGAHRRRLALAEAGVDAEVLDALGLPDRAELVRLEDDADRWCREQVRS